MLLSIMSHETTMYSYDHGNTEVRGVAGEMLSVRTPTSDWAQAEDTAQHQPAALGQYSHTKHHQHCHDCPCLQHTRDPQYWQQ